MRSIFGITAILGTMLFAVGCDSAATPNPDTGGIVDAGTDTTPTPDVPTDTPRPDTVTPDVAPPEDTVTPPPDLVTGDTVTPPPDVPPGKCQVADVTGAPAVTIVNGTVTPAGTGGEITTGRWVLSTATVDAALDVEGSLQGALQVAASSATTGGAGVAFAGNITSPIPTTFDENGSGSYTTSAEAINIAVDPNCGSEPPIDMGEYTVNGNSLTLWATLQVMGIPVDIEAVFTKQ